MGEKEGFKIDEADEKRNPAPILKEEHRIAAIHFILTFL